jgi:hypothetical protein
MKDIDNILDEYKLAVKENIEASKLETEAKDRKRKAYYKLLKVSERLRETTRETLEDTLIL